MIERYARPEMAAIWDEEFRLALWLKIEIEAVRAWAGLGAVPADAADRISERAVLDRDRMLELERETHHDVVAFLGMIAERVGPDARFIHLGMTSSDILDTATAVQIQRAGALVLDALAELRRSVRRLALEHRATPIAGRTHGVHAEPMSLGLKFATWWDELRRTGDNLAFAVHEAAVGKLSGAVGTYANIDPGVEESVCKALGIRPAPVSSQIVARDRHARYLNALALVGSVVARQALEIRLLARTETSEILEGFGARQTGSSAMPHKRNPIKCEQMCGLARLLRSNAAAGMENIGLWHERDISHSSVERVILPDSSIVAHHMLVRFRNVVEDLDLRPGRMRENLEATRGLVFSGTVLTRLIEAGMTREEAYGHVQHAAMGAGDAGTPFRQALLGVPEIVEALGERGIDEALDLDRHLGATDGIFERLGINKEE